MDYNTQRGKMLLPEYGRNVQKLVEFAKTVENREERNIVAMAIIGIMGNLNPQLRDITDFKHKLWDHLAIIADFELDVDSPYAVPQRDILFEKPKIVPYNNEEIRFKHYGKIIEHLIQKAIEFEEGDEKNALIEVIANHMKKSYLKWNKDVVEDKSIFEDIRYLSKNKIIVDENLKLTDSKEFQVRPPKKAKRQIRRK